MTRLRTKRRTEPGESFGKWPDDTSSLVSSPFTRLNWVLVIPAARQPAKRNPCKRASPLSGGDSRRRGNRCFSLQGAQPLFTLEVGECVPRSTRRSQSSHLSRRSHVPA